MRIDGERVYLRPLALADLEQLVVWNLDPDVSRYLEGDYPTEMEACEAWFRRVRGDRHNRRFAVLTRDGSLVGDIELDQIAWRSREAELRICIGEKHFWDRGLGTDAVRTLCGYAFNEMRLKRVYLRVYCNNRRAVRCYEKAGFRKEGTLVRPNAAGVPQKILLMVRTASAPRRGRRVEGRRAQVSGGALATVGK